jgi:hypothetical protein
MAALDIPAAEKELQIAYRERAVVIAYEERPFFGEIEKKTNFKGKHYEFTPRYEHGGGRSVSYAEAEAAETPVDWEAFKVPRVSEYYTGSISGEALEATEGGDLAAEDALEAQFDGSANNAAESISSALFRDGTGVIGQIKAGSAINSTVVTLSTKYDIRQFYKGQRLQAANPTGPALRVGGAGFVTVAKINFQKAQLTLTAALNAGITDIVVGDFLLNKGDFNGKMKGLMAWCPEDVADADSFLGVNRSVWRERLAGSFIDGGGANKEEIVEEVIAVASSIESKPDRAYLHPDDLKDFKIQAGNRIKYDMAKATAFGMPTISFEGIQIQFNSRILKMLPDPTCPRGRGFFVRLSSMHLRTLGTAPKFLNADKLTNRILRIQGEDTYRYRMGTRGNLVVERPIDVIHVKW